MIRTSNFSRWGRSHWPGAVGIARRPPPWFTGPTYFPLAPSTELVGSPRGLDWASYQRIYWGEPWGILEEPRRLLDPHRVLADLQALVPLGAEIVLLCWEGRDDVLSGRGNCHRILLHGFFRAAGIECEEIR